MRGPCRFRAGVPHPRRIALGYDAGDTREPAHKAQAHPGTEYA